MDYVSDGFWFCDGDCGCRCFFSGRYVVCCGFDYVVEDFYVVFLIVDVVLSVVVVGDVVVVGVVVFFIEEVVGFFEVGCIEVVGINLCGE